MAERVQTVMLVYSNDDDDENIH